MRNAAVENMVMREINRDGKGRPYENMMSAIMGALCASEGLGGKAVIGTSEDRFGGTDYVVYDNLDMVTGSSGILRIDFTTAFSEKDNMPLVWEPQSPIEQINGHPLKFGIRTGNGAHGFNCPVVVIGIDATGNENPDDDVDVDFVMGKLQANTKKYAKSILYEAGMAMATYVYETNPDYAAWCETEEGQDYGVIPSKEEKARLSPNFRGIGACVTNRASRETISGIKLAKEKASSLALSRGTPKSVAEKARDFVEACEKTEDRLPNMRRGSVPWAQKIQEFEAAAKRYEQPDDGLST